MHWTIITFINEGGKIIIYTEYKNREDHYFDNEKYSFLIQILLSEISDIHFQYIERQHRTVCSYVSNNVQYRSAIVYNAVWRISYGVYTFYRFFQWFRLEKLCRQHVKLSVHNARLIWWEIKNESTFHTNF